MLGNVRQGAKCGVDIAAHEQHFKVQQPCGIITRGATLHRLLHVVQCPDGGEMVPCGGCCTLLRTRRRRCSTWNTAQVPCCSLLPAVGRPMPVQLGRALQPACARGR